MLHLLAEGEGSNRNAVNNVWKSLGVFERELRLDSQNASGSPRLARRAAHYHSIATMPIYRQFASICRERVLTQARRSTDNSEINRTSEEERQTPVEAIIGS